MSIGSLSFEALLVGIGFVILFFIVHWIAMKCVGEKAMMNHLYLATQVFIAGAFFHIVCECTGMNEWYCSNRKQK